MEKLATIVKNFASAKYYLNADPKAPNVLGAKICFGTRSVSKMAEMTASEAIDRLRLQGDYEFDDVTIGQAGQIAAVIEQQAAEIAKKGRMLAKACKELEDYTSEYGGGDKSFWYEWLEKEAEVQNG